MDSQERDEAAAQTTKVTEDTTNGDIMDEGLSTKDSIRDVDTSTTEPTAQNTPKPEPAAQPQERQDDRNSNSPEHKRKATRSPSPSTKRQRTSLSPSAARNFQHSSRQHGAPSGEPVPVRVRPDDKARTRRLFGGMLNTIAAKPSSRRAPYEAPRRVDPAKREELERKAAEREKLRLKEEEEARREREVRRREENRERYMRWERDTIMARCGNERMKAEYLRTEAKPELYYKPYILTSDQKDTIERQVEDTELSIQRDIRHYEEIHPDQSPLPWKPLATKSYNPGDDSPQDGKIKEDTPQVSPLAPDTNMATDEPEPLSKLDGAEERQQEHKKERTRTDEFEEEVIETEGGVSLIY